MQKYFKGLDILRAITPLAIIWGHIEILKNEAGIPNLINSNFPFFPQGHIRVMLFFVLSGFIITYLLIKEKNNRGRICVKSFYIKRLLRIIPLYFLIMILSYCLFQKITIAILLRLFYSILPLCLILHLLWVWVGLIALRYGL